MLHIQVAVLSVCVFVAHLGIYEVKERAFPFLVTIVPQKH